jgi:hypothetical protein
MAVFSNAELGSGAADAALSVDTIGLSNTSAGEAGHVCCAMKQWLM